MTGRAALRMACGDIGKNPWGAPKGTPRVRARSPGRAIGRDPPYLRPRPHQRASVKMMLIGFGFTTLQAAAACSGVTVNRPFASKFTPEMVVAEGGGPID